MKKVVELKKEELYNYIAKDDLVPVIQALQAKGCALGYMLKHVRTGQKVESNLVRTKRKYKNQQFISSNKVYIQHQKTLMELIDFHF